MRVLRLEKWKNISWEVQRKMWLNKPNGQNRKKRRSRAGIFTEKARFKAKICSFFDFWYFYKKKRAFFRSLL